MRDNIIETNNLALKAGYRYLLNDITWQVKPGENWIIFGLNGSGKFQAKNKRRGADMRRGIYGG